MEAQVGWENIDDSLKRLMGIIDVLEDAQDDHSLWGGLVVNSLAPKDTVRLFFIRFTILDHLCIEEPFLSAGRDL